MTEPADAVAGAVVVMTTVADRGDADRIAGALVEARLAACVQCLTGVRSTYRWAGRVEQAEECLLLVKTAADRADAVATWLRAQHPYELPEILVVEARGGLSGYLEWVHRETRPL
ncbi:MAG: divalent-cation tolerance protein CutA [Xanthomonadales bacterium]|nr:divalent-cation tolerance protein CutA [Xanthomonadales bacterium]